MSHWSFIDFLNASKSAFMNKKEIKQCDFVGCFHCMKHYRAQKITKYIDDTAHCNLCGEDAVIGDITGYPIEDISFLKHMYWYGYCHVQKDDGTIVPIKNTECQLCNSLIKYKITDVTVINDIDPFIMEGYTIDHEYMLFTIKQNILTIKLDNVVIYREAIKDYPDSNYDISLGEIVKIEAQYFCEFL